MNLEQARLLGIADLKNIAEQIGLEIKGIKSKVDILDAIVEKCDELGINIPDVETKDAVLSEESVAVKPKKEFARIQDYPRRKVIVESRDPDIRDQPFSINTYTALVVMGEPVMLPEPVIAFIKSLTDVKHDVDKEGNSVYREVKRFMVSYED